MPKRDTASSLKAITRELPRPGVPIGASEEESPYVPFVQNVFIRHLAFDVRAGTFANILWVKKEESSAAIDIVTLYLPARLKEAGGIPALNLTEEMLFDTILGSRYSLR